MAVRMMPDSGSPVFTKIVRKVIFQIQEIDKNDALTGISQIRNQQV